MAYTFTASEKAEIEAARLLCPPENRPEFVSATGNWVPFYSKLSEIISRHKTAGDIPTGELGNWNSAQLWLDVAIGANGGTGMHSAGKLRGQVLHCNNPNFQNALATKSVAAHASIHWPAANFSTENKPR